MALGPSGGAHVFPFEGRVLGGYRIGRAIATGGMATVYLARKTGPGRYAQTAAIKIIHPHLARDVELTQMFLDEARLASCVNHPNVCRVLDFGESEGTYFLAMEYVRGESWATVLSSLCSDKEARSRVASLSAYVLAQACEGLHAIHEAVDTDGNSLNIVHRDVSPTNLIISYDGSVRMLDFGIASAEGRAHTSSTEVVRGRYAYMAPEQMRGLDVDRRADIWSLGVMLREAITGQNLFARETQIATMLAVTQESLPGWPARVPLTLREIADVALSRDPEQRYRDARQLGGALHRHLNAQSEPSLGAELCQHMRRLFAQQIAEKRRAVRELAGDDVNTDQFSSVFPAQTKRVEAAPSTTMEVEPSPTPSSAPRRWPVAVLVGGLFAGSLALSLALAPHESSSSQETRQPAAAMTPHARPEPEPGASSADAPAEPMAATPDAAPPPVEAPAQPSTEPSSPAEPSRGRGLRADREGAATKGEHKSVGKGPPGTVVVGTSQGWAEVIWRGQKLGTTPLRTELPSGAQTLELRPYGGGSPRRLSVDVKPGATTKVRVEL